MFITPAYAQAVPGLGGGDLLGNVLPIVLMFIIFYFLLFRPQQQRMKTHRQMLSNVRRGDTIVTSGGIVGKISKVIDDREVEVEIAKDTRVLVVRSMIAEVRVKGEPVKDNA